MINKFFATIHNKYSKLFKFVFFLRYLITIFFISSILFFSIPKFFNYEKKSKIIFKHLIKSYNYEIKNYEKIQFQIIPLPNIEFKNVNIRLSSSPKLLNVRSLKIFPKFLSIYNFENFQTNKLVLKDSYTDLEISTFKNFIKKQFTHKNKIIFDNLNLKIIDKNKSIIHFENIQFANFGYNKNLINGEIFKKKFKAKVNKDLDDINFSLLKSGINANINFSLKSDSIEGIFKSKILNSNIKFDFNINKKVIRIYNSFFRNNYLSFKNEGLIILEPYLYINSFFEIEDIDKKILKKIDLEKLLDSKNFVKKLNSEFEINFKSRKFNRDLVDDLNLKLDLAYGRINYLKKITILDNILICEGDLNFLEEYPILFFKCSISLEDSQRFLKKFSIKTKNKIENFKINFEGNLNILNNRINLKKVLIDNNYEASKEDLEFFNKIVENNILDESIFEIFKVKKIKEFIEEII